MSWYDGTTSVSLEKIETEYPVVINEDLRVDEALKNIVIINRFKDGDPLLELSDPKVETDEDTTFYHVFRNNLLQVKEFFVDFMKGLNDDEHPVITLIREDTDCLFKYGCGHICSSLIDSQEELSEKLPEEVKESGAFVLPLKIYKFKCPVCGYRTLPEKGMFFICDECGWEDGAIFLGDVELDFLNPNNTSISKYREKYLKHKEQNPAYRWSSRFNK